MAIGYFNSDLLSVWERVVQILWWKMLHYRWSKHLPENTFHGDASDTVLWFDHAICSTAMCNKITSMNVLYSYLTSDHFVPSVKLYNVITEIPPNLCTVMILMILLILSVFIGIGWPVILCLNILISLTDYCVILTLCVMLYIALVEKIDRSYFEKHKWWYDFQE